MLAGTCINTQLSTPDRRQAHHQSHLIGTHFYMEAGELYHPAHVHAFVPAWLVPLSDDPTMKVESYDVTWKYNYGGTGTGSQSQAMHINVTIFTACAV